MVINLKKFLKGFTLIELIIVIGIVAILSTGAYLMLMKWMSKGRDARKIADINALSKGVLIYELENYGFPTPSNAITLTDQYGEEIGKQGLFDKQVVEKLSSIHKTVKDPFTNEYYSYTTYDKHRGFEIGTFIESMGKIGFNISNTTYADDESINPYVFVYGKVKVCEDNGVIKYPNPVSVFDKNQYKYVNTKTMGNAGKVMFNMKYLNGSKEALEGSGSICDGEVQAPIVGFQSYNTGMNLKQGNQENIVNTTDGILEIIEEQCTHNDLCNSPDIYRVRYNLYVITYYNPVTKEVTLIEAEYDVNLGKFVEKSKEVIFDGSGTSGDRGKIYGIATSPKGYYQIYYGGGAGGVQVYTQGGGSGGGASGGTNVVGGAGSSYQSMQLHGGASVAQGDNQTLVAFSKDGTSEGYVAKVLAGDGSASTQVTKLPFECRMPKIIYLNEDVYLLTYIDEDGHIGVKKITYKAGSSSPSIEEYQMDGLVEEINYIDIEHLGKDLVGIIITKTSGESLIKILNNQEYGLMNTDKEVIDIGPISNIQMVSGGKGDLNITFTKGTSSVTNYYKVSQEGFLSLVKSSPISGTDPKLSLIGPTDVVNIGGGKPLSIATHQNEPVKVVQEADEDDTKGSQIVKFDSSWITNVAGTSFTNSGIQLGKVPSLYISSNYNGTLGDNISFINNFNIGSDLYIGTVSTPIVQELANSITRPGIDTIGIYKYDGNDFVNAQSITGLNSSTAKLDYFSFEGMTFMAVASNRQTKYGSSGQNTKIFKWDRDEFNQLQTLPSGLNVKFFEISGTNYIILNRGFTASCYIPTTGVYAAGFPKCTRTHNLESIIYKWDGTKFVNHQTIKLPNANESFTYDSDIFQIGSDYFLTIGTVGVKSRSGKGYLYKRNGTSFAIYQTFNGSSIHTLKYFEKDGGNYLIVLSLDNKNSLYKRDGFEFVHIQDFYGVGINSLDLYEKGADLYLLMTTHIKPSSLVDGRLVYATNYGFVYNYKWNGNGFDLILNSGNSPNMMNFVRLTLGGKDFLFSARLKNAEGYANSINPDLFYYMGRNTGKYGTYNLEVYEIGEQSLVNNFVVFNTPESSSIILDDVQEISDIIIDEEKPAGTDIKYLVSFDNGNSFKTMLGENWETVTKEEMKTKGMSSNQFRQALLGMDEEAINLLVSKGLDGKKRLYFIVGMETSNPDLSSSLKSIKVIYNKSTNY
ncbi:MAG: type II secretion system protein [Candidatus Absconditabacteria bacterium]